MRAIIAAFSFLPLPFSPDPFSLPHCFLLQTSSESVLNAPRLLHHPFFVTAKNIEALKSQVYAKLPSRDKAWNNVTMSYWCNKWGSLLPLNGDVVMAEMPMRLRVFISVSSADSFQRNSKRNSVYKHSIFFLF